MEAMARALGRERLDLIGLAPFENVLGKETETLPQGGALAHRKKV
jgi:hypothetical protein